MCKAALSGAILVFSTLEVTAANIVVLGEDSGSGAVLRDSRPFKTALDIIRGRLASYDLTVYDEASGAIKLNYVPGKPRNEAEVLEFVGALKEPPIDRAAIMALFADVRDTSYGSKFDLRMTAKVLSVPSGKIIGTFTSRSLESTPLPANCGEDCLLEAVSEKVESLGLDLADQIGRVMPVKSEDGTDCDLGPCDEVSAVDLNEFKVILRYPTEQLTNAFENMALGFPDSDLKPVSSDRAAQVYWLKTSLTTLELKRSLSKLKGRLPHAMDLRVDGDTIELRVPN